MSKKRSPPPPRGGGETEKKKDPAADRREQFTFYRSFYDAVSAVEDPILRLEVYEAIVSYALDGKSLPTGRVAVQTAILLLVRPILDAARKKGQLGRVGGKVNRKQEQGQGQEQGPVQAQDQDQDQMIRSDSVCVRDTHTADRAPTMDELTAYCREKGYSVDPARIYAYYAPHGWRRANGAPIADWRSLVDQWEIEDKRKTAQTAQGNLSEAEARRAREDMERARRLLAQMEGGE